MARTQIAVLNDLQRSGDAPLEFQLVPLVLMDHWNKWRVTALLSDSEGRLDKITNAGEYLPHKNFVICDLEERKFLQVTVSRGTVYYRSVRPSGVPTAGHPPAVGLVEPLGVLGGGSGLRGGRDGAVAPPCLGESRGCCATILVAQQKKLTSHCSA